MGKELILIGKGESRSWYDEWRKLAPEAEVWTLNGEALPESSLHFDVHEDRRFWGGYGETTCRWIVSPFAPPGVLEPRMHVFPLKECRRVFGYAYFECTLDYMLALALLRMKRGQDRWERIWLPGFDMADGRHYTFRPGAHFWLGVARGMNIGLKLPASSMLLRRIVDFPPTPHGDPNFLHAYGQTVASTGPVAADYGW